MALEAIPFLFSGRWEPKLSRVLVVSVEWLDCTDWASFATGAEEGSALLCNGAPGGGFALFFPCVATLGRGLELFTCSMGKPLSLIGKKVSASRPSNMMRSYGEHSLLRERGRRALDERTPRLG
jgi:hypothetical protein